MKARIPEENLPKEEIMYANPEEVLPLLISVEDDGSETFLIQSKDYKFAQFLAIVQNRCNLELINRILKEGLSEKADQNAIDNLIHFVIYYIYGLRGLWI